MGVSGKHKLILGSSYPTLQQWCLPISVQPMSGLVELIIAERFGYLMAKCGRRQLPRALCSSGWMSAMI